MIKKSGFFLFNKKHNRQVLIDRRSLYDGGFAVLVFVIIISISMMYLLIDYSENQKRIGDNVREIVNKEDDIQAVFMCLSILSNTFSKYSHPNDDIITYLNGLNKASKGVDLTANVRGVSLSCKVFGVSKCKSSDCSYSASIDGYSIRNSVLPYVYEYKTEAYIEWRAGEYNTYISKLKFVK